MNKSILLIVAALVLGAVLLLIGIFISRNDRKSEVSEQAVVESPTETAVVTQPQAQLANPASQNCVDKGGTVEIQTRGDGGQYGLCDFGSGMECEEWALYRGECPVGGVRTTGFDNIQQKYCAWSGGQTLAVPNAICTFDNGATCPVDAYYNGTCTQDQPLPTKSNQASPSSALIQ